MIDSNKDDTYKQMLALCETKYSKLKRVSRGKRPWRPPDEEQDRLEKRAASLISQFIKSGKVAGKDFAIAEEDENALVDELADILSQASTLGSRHALAMIEHHTRAFGIGKVIGIFVQRAKEIVLGIIGRVQDVVLAIFADGGSVEDVQDAVDSLLDTLPETVATTEVHTEVEQAIAAVFAKQGVELVEWITEPGACHACSDNEEQGPIKQGTAFASGDMAPPAHPRCRCNVVPSAIEEQGS